MADAGDGVDISEATESLDDMANQVERLKQSSDGFRATTNNYISAAEKLSNIPGLDGASASAQQFRKSLLAGVDGARELAGELDGTGETGSASMGKIDVAAKKSASMLSWFGKQFDRTLGSAFKQAENLSQRLLKGADAAGGFLALKGYKEFVTRVDGASGVIRDIQAPLLETRKLAIQTGLGFGQSFAKASSDLDSFHTAMGRTQANTRATRDEMNNVQKSLREAFAPEEMIKNLKGLEGANKNFESSINVVNAALLVAKAKGMSEAATAEMMTKAHLELGETADSVPLIFARIADAAEDSGLQYSKVSSTVMKSAEDLKMWGGTVGSVTPVFKAFSRTLGDGQKGLAPELVQRYVSGLKGMGFEMKALAGMRASGAAGGAGAPGAIRAGLEMEALMGKGEEGMVEMSENLINVIKGMAGGTGEIITQAEALTSDDLALQFKMQRDLLKQSIGGDDASNTKMLEMLKGINEGGMEVGKDMQKRLHENMKAGEDTGKKTTDAMVQATLDLDATVQTQGTKMLDVAERILGSMPGAKAGRRALRGIAKGETGLMGGIKNFAKESGLESVFDTVTGQVQKITKRAAITEEEKKSVKEGQQGGVKFIEDAFSKVANMRQATMGRKEGGFGRLAGNERQLSRLGAGQEVKTKLVMPELKQILNGINQEISALRGKKDKTQEEAARLVTVRQGRNELRTAMQRKKINLADFGKAKTGEDESEMGEKEKSEAFNQRARARLTEGRKLYGAKKPDITVGEPARKMVARRAETPKRIERTMRSSETVAPKLPTREAQQATESVQKQKLELEVDKSRIEKEVVFKIIPDKSSVKIEVDKQDIETIVTAHLGREADKS